MSRPGSIPAPSTPTNDDGAALGDLVLRGLLLGPLRAVGAQYLERPRRLVVRLERSDAIGRRRLESLLDVPGAEVVPELVFDVLGHRPILCPVRRRRPPAIVWRHGH